MLTTFSFFLLSFLVPSLVATGTAPPIVIHTWGGPFTVAADAAFHALTNARSVVDAVQIGGAACEANQCDGTVGYGGSPAEDCETTLDAMIMDGDTLNVGAVGALRRVRDAIAVAGHVLRYTEHTMLVGELATQFATQHGFREEDLATDGSRGACEAWKRNHCQPNSRVGVLPGPRRSCGPYSPSGNRVSDAAPEEGEEEGEEEEEEEEGRAGVVGRRGPGHDTISLVALGEDGSMAAGTTTNGKAHKIPGRVGDGPVAGSGAYVDSRVGGCGATGDGDLMMRLLPCYQAVESMRQGMSPAAAAEDAVRRMLDRFPRIQAGIVVMNNKGEHAAAASGWRFTYSFRRLGMEKTQVVVVDPINGSNDLYSEL
ncbi:aspartylglucosaminidase [Metarhizium album ARSEF 1941]|uniref:Aspartylglucosaminidase n=1 Tax=Metarhizium album (strain ARSEF 1941) TaxID=1081103 RepID=A0A0B2WPH5_METAS|nr:aspartylglucosaminidase [Metarhizium album ARSEF 1941]KHN95918.1 aspartylglucosaminidase [Metarhizium album ARSEF 1941]